LAGVVGLIVDGRVVADPEETRRPNAIVVGARAERPGIELAPPRFVAGVQLSLDALLDIAADIPLTVERQKIKDAAADADAEVVVDVETGRDDARDVAVGVLLEPGRHDPEGVAAVGVGLDIRNGKYRCGLRIEPRWNVKGLPARGDQYAQKRREPAAG